MSALTYQMLTHNQQERKKMITSQCKKKKKSGKCHPLKRVWLEGRLTVEKWGHATCITASLYFT